MSLFEIAQADGRGYIKPKDVRDALARGTSTTELFRDLLQAVALNGIENASDAAGLALVGCGFSTEPKRSWRPPVGMSTHVIGFMEPDEDYAKKAAAWRACKAAAIEPPEELVDLFDGNEPQDSGMNVDIEPAVRDWSNNHSSGYEVDVTKLPKGLKIVRFYNSW